MSLPLARSMMILLGLAFGMTAVLAAAGRVPPVKAFSEANRLYEQGEYEHAAAAYEQIIRNQQTSPSIYFNLGNAHFKAGRIGRAIVAYRQARQLAPRDPEIRTNLQLARRQAGGGETDAPNLWNRFLQHLTLNEWSALAGVLIALWFLLLTAREWKPELKQAWRGYTAGAGILALCAAALLLGAIYERFYVQSAVVVIPEAVARRGPFDESAASFTIRDGAELAVLDRKDHWLQVSDPSNQIGWISESQVVVMNSGPR